MSKEFKGKMEGREDKGDNELQGNKQCQGQNNSQGHLEPGGDKETQRKKQSTDDVDCHQLDGVCLEEGEIEDSPDENLEIDMTSGKHETNIGRTSRFTADQRTKRTPDRHKKIYHSLQRSDNYSQINSPILNLNIKRRSPMVSMSGDVYRPGPVYDGSGKEAHRIREVPHHIERSDLTRGHYNAADSTHFKRQPSSTFSREELEHNNTSDVPFWYALTETQFQEKERRKHNNYSHHLYSAMNKGYKRKCHFEDAQEWIGPNKRICDKHGKRVGILTKMGPVDEHNKRANLKKRNFLDTVSYLMRPCHSHNHVATILADRNDKLQTYLNSNDECPKLTQLLTVLKNCAKANNLHKMCKLKIMNTLRTCKFFERKDVIELLKEPDASQNSSNFIENLLFVMNTMIHLVGLEERDASIALSLIKRSCETWKDVEQKIKKLIMKIEEVYAKKRVVGKVFYEKIETFARTLPVLPTIESIRSRHQVVIPKHHVNEGFADELSYVSYMFDLLREDFVRPLVMGIQSFIDHIEKRECAKFYNSDVRCYEGVSIVSTSTTIENGIVWRIQLDSNFCKKSQMPSILQYGSLLCLSHDGFRTIHYATVTNRDPAILINGQIEIKFIDAYTVNTNMTFVMIESKAFYESCSHSLEYLKQLSDELEQDGSVPMGKYLAHLTTEIDSPEYLNEFETFSFKSLSSYGSGQHSADPSVDDDETDDVDANLDNDREEDSYDTPLEGDSQREILTSAKQFGLDTSQYEALKLVLENEIALVQGPPGTGKTMMGVRIAEYFLANRKYFLETWLRYSNKHVKKPALVRSPLLLVSYTNHALDQFLQLLLETKTMIGCLPLDVVRVGSRCEVEKLQQFTLTKHRYNNRHVRQRNSFNFLKDRMRWIEELKIIHSQFFSYLVHEQTLSDYNVIDVRHIWQLQNSPFVYDMPSNNTILFEWLHIRQFRHSVQVDYEEGRNFSFLQQYDVDQDELWAEDRIRLLENDDDLIHNEEVSTHNWHFKIPEPAVTYSVLKEYPDFNNHSKEECNRILQRLRLKIGSPDRMSFTEMCNIDDIWVLEDYDRWRLYRYWVDAATIPITETIKDFENQFNAESLNYKEARNLTDLCIMKNALIVAMTTTAAAKYTEVLKELAAPIVIIEEAAQVSEQHVLSTMSKSCQHLIMIGDHQQLKPAYNDYLLAKEYHTDVSLFERLVRNQFPYKQLQKQHRMRPEISALLVPHIYENLDDDESVFNYPDVRGVASNTYFISHNVPEDDDAQSLSHSNKYEAEYLSQLYRYLRLQGYRSTDITVLTMYKDQVRILRRHITEVEITDVEDNDVSSGEAVYHRQTNENRRMDVRVTSVDNFQGEENRIILLSLVRSNKDGKIGYLAKKNRVCVSLSRAKEGLYVIGNMDCIRKRSPLWEKIISKAKNNKAYGKTLELKCKNHPSLKMIVSSPSDFKAFKDGGCSNPCTTRLKCGHACQRLCHTFDEKHVLPCQKLCVKTCSRGHKQNIECSQELRCTETVTVVLQTCGHEVETECHNNIFDVRCTHKCDNILSCGHKCQRKCGEKCNTEQNCNELVKVTGNCGHANQIACCKKMSMKCRVPCHTILECMHLCNGTCGKCHSGRLHVPCQMKCKRKLICGHICGAKCTQVCPPCTQKCKVACKHSKCEASCGKECVDCREPCSWQCKTNCKKSFKCTMLCHEICNRDRCNIPCRRFRKCHHRQRCIGLKCEEECICRRCSDPENFEIFFGSEDDEDAIFYRLPDCRHLFEVKALDQYMDTPSDSVGMKVCPRCTTPILKAERYNNIIKACLHDINNVKIRLLSNGKEFSKQKSDLLQRIIHIKSEKHRKAFLASHGKIQNIFQVDSLDMQLGFYLNVTNLLKKVTTYKLKDEKRCKELLRELNDLLSWVCLERFRHSDQETREFAMEMRRLRYCFRVSVVQESILLKKDVPENHTQWIQGTLGTLFGGSKLDEENAEQIEKELREFERFYPQSGLGISDDERIMILTAMDFREKGHWYKCKNGHVYAIGECGGATMESRCPECSEAIGGGSHRLREDNSVAGEMDGARHSAWSEQANMENYVI